jgi:putative NIF3 family GTP cyclohydrolase 1 type 2
MKSLAEVVAYLDDRFHRPSYQPDVPFSVLVPEVYARDGRQAEAELDRQFFPHCNGLMLTSSRDVRHVYLAVFLSEEIVQAIERHEAGGEALIFTHHPLDMETSGRGFLPLSRESIAVLRRRGVSVYSLHNPLDQDPFISTNRAVARKLGLCALRSFTPFGIIGHFPHPVSAERFQTMVRESLHLPSVNSIIRTESVRTVALIAGGGSKGDLFNLAANEGVDVYLTGTYNNQIQNEVGARHRQELEQFLQHNHTLSLVEASHYATEAPVLTDDIASLCENELRLPAFFIPQADCWH